MTKSSGPEPGEPGQPASGEEGMEGAGWAAMMLTSPSDRSTSFRMAERILGAILYDQEDREGAEWLYSLKGRGKGPMSSSLRRYLAGEVGTKIGA